MSATLSCSRAMGRSLRSIGVAKRLRDAILTVRPERVKITRRRRSGCPYRIPADRVAARRADHSVQADGVDRDEDVRRGQKLGVAVAAAALAVVGTAPAMTVDVH